MAVVTLVAGIDSSTQSVKVLVCDAVTGEVVREGRAEHPDGTECPPSAWRDALTDASRGLLDDVAAVSVAGQQHGMVLLDDQGEVVRPALLWNDIRSAQAADDLVRELGGPQAWADAAPNGWPKCSRRAGEFDDPVPQDVLERFELIDRTTAFHDIHAPETMGESGRARRRLVFDELFRVQLELVQRKKTLEATTKGIDHDVQVDWCDGSSSGFRSPHLRAGSCHRRHHSRSRTSPSDASASSG